MGDENSGPKIQVDSDWKDEARREKQQLADQEAQASAAGPLPDPNFLEIVNMLAMQAAVSIGGYQLQTGEMAPPDLPMAKHLIDMLDMLGTKTKGNLADEEKKALDSVLYEMRMRYVQASQNPAQPPTPGT
ncbi:MAG: DUF1844 domain-containing protein [Phycisphaerae bacterium]|nr:DUF1844 domain-containing protein [Phycisphaerae bacterium]